MSLVDPATKRAGLMALIASGGSPNYAQRALAQQGIKLSTSTLSDWKTRYATELGELHTKHAPQIEAHLVRQSRDLAVAAHEAALLAVEKTVQALENGDVKDPASAARNLEVTAATAIDKTLILTGRPQSITEHREPSQLIDSLRSKGISVSVETSKTTQDPTKARFLAAPES